MKFETVYAILDRLRDGMDIQYISDIEGIDRDELIAFLKRNKWFNKSSDFIKKEMNRLKAERDSNLLRKKEGPKDVPEFNKAKKPKRLPSLKSIKNKQLKAQKKLESIQDPAKIRSTIERYGIFYTVSEFGFRHKQALLDFCRKHKIDTGE